MIDIATRLRQTRANMIGTEDEDHYWDCQDAADHIESQRKLINDYVKICQSYALELKQRNER